MYCMRCGAKNLDESNFCKECGLKLGPVPPTEVDTTPTEIAPTDLDPSESFEATQNTHQPEMADAESKRNRNVGMAVVAGFIVVIMLLVAGLFGDELKGLGMLSGAYKSESKQYSVVFDRDGTCLWYQDGLFFNGTYEKDHGGWTLRISGNLIYDSTVFFAQKVNGNLVIDGGSVDEEIFEKVD